VGGGGGGGGMPPGGRQWAFGYYNHHWHRRGAVISSSSRDPCRGSIMVPGYSFGYTRIVNSASASGRRRWPGKVRGEACVSQAMLPRAGAECTNQFRHGRAQGAP
jgi:hypothetical protein